MRSASPPVTQPHSHSNSEKLAETAETLGPTTWHGLRNSWSRTLPRKPPMKPCAIKNTNVGSPTREELTAYMYLVHQVVARVLRKLPPNVLRDDLVAAGTFGLVDALRKSADRGPAFDWYARIRIRGAVVDELRAQDWLTRRARTRVAKAQAQGESGSVAVVGFD